MDFQTKRKNDDDKAKGCPRRWAVLAVECGLLILGLGLVAFFALRPSNASPYPAARLVYTSDGHQISLNLQTGERTSLTERISTDYKSVLSPDGEQIARWDLVTEYYEWSLVLQSLTVPDTSKTLLTCLCFGSPLSWSPDNQWIAYSALPDTASYDNMPDSTEELWMINVNTRQIKRLTSNNFRDSAPAFSPDGTQIAYTSAADGYNRLYVMDVATGQSRLLTPDMHGYRATWSPDGQWIAFMTTHLDYNGDIWIIRADGTGAQAITTGTTRDDDPMWVP